jgi:hypothetical protein
VRLADEIKNGFFSRPVEKNSKVQFLTFCGKNAKTVLADLF